MFIKRSQIGAVLLALFAAWNSPAVEVTSPGIEAVVRVHFPPASEGGLAVLVVRKGVVLHCKGYGRKNGGEPVTSRTGMGLASVTKQFTAMCAALLIEEGKLSLGDKVSRHLPGLHLPTTGRDLLVRDLVWHTSGLANFIATKEKTSIAEFKQQRGLRFLDNQTHAEWLATMPLRRAPGMQWEYTNSGYVLLARIVEVVAGRPFHEFQQERIFDVLGMADTTDSSRFNGSGNMITTLDDYLKWDRALWTGSLLEAKTATLLYQSGILDNGEPVGYGFGWRVSHENGQLVEMRHDGVGSPPGNSRNFVLRDVRNRITIALFARENLRFTRAFRSEFGHRLLDQARSAASGATPGDQD